MLYSRVHATKKRFSFYQKAVYLLWHGPFQLLVNTLWKDVLWVCPSLDEAKLAEKERSFLSVITSARPIFSLHPLALLPLTTNITDLAQPQITSYRSGLRPPTLFSFLLPPHPNLCPKYLCISTPGVGSTDINEHPGFHGHPRRPASYAADHRYILYIQIHEKKGFTKGRNKDGRERRWAANWQWQ